MRILITGGLGFIGINTALKFAENNEVHILDNFTRKGNAENLKIISNSNITVHIKDIRNQNDIESIWNKINPDVVIHLAGQVAVTTSVVNPREDFEINILGTFNLLECLRKYSPETIFLFSSTNKVYGEYDTQITETEKKYVYKDILGINEDVNLNFHSPYGCSKGSADQYVRDYNRIYGLKTVVLRQSCIYGPNQFGIEDQGWVSWFTIASNFDKKFYIYGDGKQVRDVLHIIDLVNLYDMIIKNIENCVGKIYNVGGGSENSLSLLELIEFLEKYLNKKINFEFSNWRHGDQKIYISDITKIKKDIGWIPKINTKEGLLNLCNWVSKNKKLFESLKLI
jgi:CDP-paratose 2-epimerase